MRLGWLRGLWLLCCLPCVAWASGPVISVTELTAAPAVMPAALIAPGDAPVTASEAWLGAGGGNHQLWYAIGLTHDWHAASPPLLVIEGNVLDRITVYMPPDYSPRTDSIFDPTLDPAFSHRAVVYRLPRGLRAGEPVYLGFGAMRQKSPVRVYVVDAAGYHASDLRYVRTHTFFISVQVSMVLVILCFLVVLRDRVFLYFIVYASALVAYGMAGSGELYALPFTSFLGQFGNRTILSTATVAAAFLIWFTLDFAGLRKRTPRLAAWLGISRWLFLAIAVAVWLPDINPSKWPGRAMNWLLVPSSVLLLVSAWLAWRRGNRQAGFFLLSWTPLLLLTALRAAQILTHLPLPQWLAYGFPGSMTWAALIITVGLADRVLQTRQERDIATRLAQFDPLTGVLNRRAIMEALHAVWRPPHGDAPAVAVLFLDLDRFKQINDSFGHAAGDACLVAVTGAIRAELEASGRVARYGGEEFLVVLNGADAAGAVQLATRITRRVAALQVRVGGRLLAFTVSIGVATREADTASPEALVEMADAAQYRAKADGRNRVVEYRVGLRAAAFAH